MPSFSLQYRGQVICSDTLEGIVEYAGRVAEAQERERCAKIADRHPDDSDEPNWMCEDCRGCCEVIAGKIRSGT
jgi:hypothetical protein